MLSLNRLVLGIFIITFVFGGPLYECFKEGVIDWNERALGYIVEINKFTDNETTGGVVFNYVFYWLRSDHGINFEGYNSIDSYVRDMGSRAVAMHVKVSVWEHMGIDIDTKEITVSEELFYTMLHYALEDYEWIVNRPNDAATTLWLKYGPYGKAGTGQKQQSWKNFAVAQTNEMKTQGYQIISNEMREKWFKAFAQGLWQTIDALKQECPYVDTIQGVLKKEHKQRWGQWWLEDVKQQLSLEFNTSTEEGFIQNIGKQAVLSIIKRRYQDYVETNKKSPARFKEDNSTMMGECLDSEYRHISGRSIAAENIWRDYNTNGTNRQYGHKGESWQQYTERKVLEFRRNQIHKKDQ